MRVSPCMPKLSFAVVGDRLHKIHCLLLLLFYCGNYKQLCVWLLCIILHKSIRIGFCVFFFDSLSAAAFIVFFFMNSELIGLYHLNLVFYRFVGNSDTWLHQLRELGFLFVFSSREWTICHVKHLSSVVLFFKMNRVCLFLEYRSLLFLRFMEATKCWELCCFRSHGLTSSSAVNYTRLFH